IHHVTRVNPYALATIADVGDVPFTNIFDPPKAMDEIAAFYRCLHEAGARPLSAGGDHSITFPIFRAIAATRPVGMVHIDAHTDTWDSFQGSKFSHGAPFRRAVEAGLLDPRRAIQIGIRGAQNYADGWDFSEANGMRVVYMEEFTSLGVEKTVRE